MRIISSRSTCCRLRSVVAIGCYAQLQRHRDCVAGMHRYALVADGPQPHVLALRPVVTLHLGRLQYYDAIMIMDGEGGRWMCMGSVMRAKQTCSIDVIGDCLVWTGQQQSNLQLYQQPAALTCVPSHRSKWPGTSFSDDTCTQASARHDNRSSNGNDTVMIRRYQPGCSRGGTLLMRSRDIAGIVNVGTSITVISSVHAPLRTAGCPACPPRLSVRDPGASACRTWTAGEAEQRAERERDIENSVVREGGVRHSYVDVGGGISIRIALIGEAKE